MRRLGILLALLMTGCAMAPTQRREDSLIRDARQFNDDLRWGRYDTLSASLTREEAPLFMARVNELGDDLQIADFEVTAIHFGPDSQSASVTVTFQWYSKRASMLHATVLDQHWEFRAGHWVVALQRRVHGDRFPLVPEPVAPPPAKP